MVIKKVKKLPKSEIELEIEISPEEFNKFVEQAGFELAKDLEVQGFRKGKVPKEVVEKELGKGRILTEAAEIAIKKSYQKAILENKIETISQPEISVIKLAFGNPFVFRVKVSVLPEVNLPDYKEIARQIKRKKISVENKEVEDALLWLQKSRAKLTFKNGPAQRGDFIEINYSYSQIKEINGRESNKDAFILGEAGFVPGFEDHLIGTRAGEEKEFSLKVPENFSFQKIAGKKIDFKVKVNSVQTVELPEINDQFARGLGNFDNLESLRKSIKEGIFLEKEQAESQRIKREILEKIAERTEMEIPDILIKKEQEAMMEDLKMQVSENLKISLEDYLAKIKKTEEEIFDSLRKEAERRVRDILILRAIGKEEKIEVSDQEINEKANEILRHYPSLEKAKRDIDLNQLKEYSKEIVRNEKVFRKLESLISEAGTSE